MSTSFLNENVPDPTDFPSQTIAPGLRKLDATFRCSICGDVYDAPVTLNCGHCFCSGCLRPALSLKQECPSCRKVANEGHIRPNYGMEDAISAWNESRAYLLSLIERSQDPSPFRVDGSPRKRKRRHSGSTSSVELVEPAAMPSNPRRRTLIPRPDSSLSINLSKGKGKSKAGEVLSIPSSDVDEQEIIPRSETLVECPLCSKAVQFQFLNPHIDRGCKDPSKENASLTWSKIMQQPKSKTKGKHKRHSDSDDDSALPKVSYATLKDRQLKDLLLQHALPVNGDRGLLEQRHQRWIMLYNANLDRSIPNRKSQAILRQDLKKWEETLSKRKKPVAVEDAKEHVKLHKSEFDRLIKLARRSQQNCSSPAHVPTTESPQPASPKKESSPGLTLTSEGSENSILIDE